MMRMIVGDCDIFYIRRPHTAIRETFDCTHLLSTTATSSIEVSIREKCKQRYSSYLSKGLQTLEYYMRKLAHDAPWMSHAPFHVIKARLSAIEVILLVDYHLYGHGLYYANSFSFRAQAASTPRSWKFPKRVSSEPSRRKQQHTAPVLKHPTLDHQICLLA